MLNYIKIETFSSNSKGSLIYFYNFMNLSILN